MIMLTYGLIDNDKNLELRTLERVESAEEKNLVFWGGSCLKKFSQQNVEKLFSWGWMVDKLVRSIFREKWRASHKLGYPTQFSRNFQRQISP